MKAASLVTVRFHNALVGSRRFDLNNSSLKRPSPVFNISLQSRCMSSSPKDNRLSNDFEHSDHISTELLNDSESLFEKIKSQNGEVLPFFHRMLPVEYARDALIFLHDLSGFSWTCTISLFTITLKLALLPLWIASERCRRRNAHLLPEALELQAKAKEAYKTGNVQQAMDIQKRISRHMSRPMFIRGAITQVTAALVQGFTFATVCGGLRTFAIRPRETISFAQENPLWLESLALEDPHYIFPALWGILLMAIYEYTQKMIGSKVNLAASTTSKTPGLSREQMQNLSRAGIFILSLASTSLNSCAFFYLIPSVVFTTVLRLATNTDFIKRLFKFKY